MSRTRGNPKHTGAPGWKPEYVEQAYNYCLLGAVDLDLCEFFDVTEMTLNRWKRRYPEFKEALANGKEVADARVAKALFHRATGYSHPDTDIKVVEGEIVKTPLTKHYPPDTTAGIFWLKNRRPKEWRDKQVVEAEGNITVEITKFSEAADE